MQRELQNANVEFKMHAFIFAVTFFVFFLIGIVPLSTVIRTKILLLSEMQDRYATMQGNIVRLQQAQTALENNKVGINYMDVYMPVETSIQNYILDLIDTVSSSAFIVKGFAQDPSYKIEGQVDLSITLEGNAYPTEIVKKIETLKRVTQVKSVTFLVGDDGQAVINLVLTIYNFVS